MIDFLLLVVQQTWAVLKDASIYLLFGFVIAGALAVLIPARMMLRVFGSGRVKSVLWAAAIGAPLPLCSCGVLPAALALRREGATDGATTAFLIATPETGVDSIAVSYALTDPLMTVARPVAGVATAITAGVATNFLGGRAGDPATRPVPASESAILAPHAHEEERAHDHHHGHAEGHTHADAPMTLSWAGALEAARRIGHYAFRDLLDETSHWLVLGIVLSGAFAALLPNDLIERYLGSGIYPMLIMLLIGIPMYTCASASTPIAAALVMKGLSPGAALCFLLGGPATNIGSLVVLVRFLGVRIVAIYLASIAVVALIAGLTVDWIYRAWAIDPRMTFGTAATWIPESVKISGAIVLLALITASLLRTRMPQEAAWAVAAFARLTGIDLMSRRLRMAALLLPVSLYAASGFFTVAPGETGIGVRFGEIVAADLAPGLHYRMPWPIGSHLVVDRDLVRRLEIGTKKEQKDLAPRAPSLMFGAVPAAKSAVVFRREAAPTESFLLTGDGNLIDLRAVVQYRVNDALAFVSSVRDPEMLLRNASLAALRVGAARSAIDAIYTVARNDLERETARSVQEFLDLCQSGIEIVSFRFLYVHAPEDVHDAFRDVASAQEDKLRTVNRAAAFAIERINESKAEAVVMTEHALAFKEERTRRAEGDAAAFRIRLQPYGETPEITKFRLRIEAAETALQGIPKVVTPGAGGVKDIDMWLFQPFLPGGKK